LELFKKLLIYPSIYSICVFEALTIALLPISSL